MSLDSFDGVARVNRCAYCGYRCQGRTCQFCADLRRIEAAMLAPDQYAAPLMRDELREAVQATKGKEA